MLKVHFLNVGHGDCTVIKHPSGRLTVIDINNSQEFDEETFAEELAEERKKELLTTTSLGGNISLLGEYAAVTERAKRELTDPIAFLKKNYPGERLWRYIQTHPDLDHMRGIKALHENIGFSNFWDTDHTKPTPNYRSDADKTDWEFYQSLRAGKVGPNIHKWTRGDYNFAFNREQDGRLGGDNIEILSPTPALVTTCNFLGKSNDVSLVLRVHYMGRSILLPGDAEALAWNEMRSYYGKALKSDFLKASHHGRDSGYDVETLKLIDPIMTIVSVGRKPDTDASRKYQQQTGRRVPSTRYHGNISIEIHDDGSWKWFVDHNPD